MVRRVPLCCCVVLCRGLQGLDRSVDQGVNDAIDSINSNYPAEVVEYCAPTFSATLLAKIG